MTLTQNGVHINQDPKPPVKNNVLSQKVNFQNQLPEYKNKIMQGLHQWRIWYIFCEYSHAPSQN